MTIHGFGNVAQYWTIWGDNAGFAWFDYDNDGAPHWATGFEVIGRSVRLIKDT